MCEYRVNPCASPAEVSLKGFSRLNEFRKEGKYCDMNVVVDGTTFPCHRNVLASASTYFDKMFGGQFKESEQKEIQLKNLSAECFQNVLEFFYTKQFNIGSSDSYELLVASIYFGEEDLENCCVEYMISHLPSDKHIVETCIYAKSNSRKRLYENSLRYIAQNWSKLCKEDNLLEISLEILEDVVKRKSLIQVRDDVVTFIPRWKEKQNADSRSVDKLLEKYECGVTPNLFVHLHTALATADYTFIYNEKSLEWKREQIFYTQFFRELNVVANDHLFTFYWRGIESSRRRDVEFQVRKSLYDVHETLSKPPICESRSSSMYDMAATRDTIYLYNKDGFDGYMLNEANNIEKSEFIASYIYDLDKWFSIPKPTYEFSDSCITSVNNQLYLMGGSVFMASESSRYVQCYDHRSPNWIMLPEMLDVHSRITSACSYDEKVYVLDDSRAHCTLEVYDLKAGRWEVLQSCSQTRSCSGARFLSYGDKLWAFPLEYSGFVECYNPVTNSWTSAKLWDGADTQRMQENSYEPRDGYMTYGVNDAFVW